MVRLNQRSNLTFFGLNMTTKRPRLKKMKLPTVGVSRRVLHEKIPSWFT
jgi:hypothetical protein